MSDVIPEEDGYIMPSETGSVMSDPDGVYKKAVTKLRMLLSAAEVASMRDGESSFNDDEEDEDFVSERGQLPFAGSVDDLHRLPGGLTDPPRSRGLYKKNRTSIGGAKRALFKNDDNGREQRHSSWHNLVHIEDTNRDRGEELSLLQRQEAYIAQLEQETKFCREQLGYVLKHVKDVLKEKENQSRTDEVNKAISGIFSTIKGWQDQESSGIQLASKESLEDDNFKLKAENLRLRDELRSQPVAPREGPLMEKVKQDNIILTEALRKVRIEAEELRRCEDEAVEQVKNSVTVAEQVRMEKTEMEYEIGQLKLQVERQQGRIRGLIEEQVTKVEEEREAIEKRANEQVRAARDEASKQVEELGRTAADLDRQQRAEVELRRQIQDRDKILDNVRADTEKRLGQLQLELVSANSARNAMEEEMSSLRIDVEHREHEARSESARSVAEVKSVRSRLAKAEEMLMASRQETLELAEVRAALEREINLNRIQMEGSVTKDNSLDLAKNQLNKELTKTLHEKELTHKMASAKLEDLIRRQSHIIGELKHQCSLVADRLEDAVRTYEAEKNEMGAAQRHLRAEHERLALRSRESDSQLAERGRLQEKLCRRLEEVERERGRLAEEVRQAWLQCETVLQEKKVMEQEASFLKELLKAKGLIPEKDNKTKKSRKVSSGKGHAIVIERNGEISSPFVK